MLLNIGVATEFMNVVACCVVLFLASKEEPQVPFYSKAEEVVPLLASAIDLHVESRPCN